MEALLIAKTSGLCFNKDDFIVEDFSVDKFVSNCRKFVSLETMQEDLRVYHKILCSAMIELINKDYTEFVNLSSNLVGLEKSINNLSIPLEKLKNEVEYVRKDLCETLTTAKTEFANYTTAYKMKVLAHHALCVLEGLARIQELNSISLISAKKPSDVLEHLALDFNVVNFHLNKISSLKNVESKKVVIGEIASDLKHHLEQLFRESLSKNDTHNLCKVLRIYAAIDKRTALEKFFAVNVVKPYMERHITEGNILKYGLSKVYSNVLNFITSSNTLLDATRKGTKKSKGFVAGFDFLVNAVFPEMVHCFDLVAPVHTYGDPGLFHVNYVSTMLFLDEFEELCQVEKSVKRLREHESYKRFISKWNLSVYFEIQFEEIAGKFEKALLEDFANLKDIDIEKRVKDNTYLLNASYSVSECVKLCYNEKIFLKPLAHNFVCLNLQLISRYHKSACRYLKYDNEENSVTSLEAAAIIRDVEKLKAESIKLFNDEICLKVDRNAVEVAYYQSIKLLEDIIPLASSIMIKSLTKQCCSHLRLISDIPRLYRKTNREVPSKPSSYVHLVFSNLIVFISETDLILPSELKKLCLQEVTNGIIVQCLILVKDVLTAIRKMEKSLRILKRARDKGSSNPSNMSDDDKIRRQLVIDVNSVEQNAKDLGLDISQLKSFKELKDLMNSTEKSLAPHTENQV